MSDQITCPNCGKTIQITDALTKQLQKDSEQKFQAELSDLKKQNEENLKKLEQKQLQKELELKKQLWQKAQEKASEKLSLEFKDLRQKSEEDEKRKKEMEAQILAERKKSREIIEKTEKAKLELFRKLDEEKEKIKLEIQQKSEEDHRLKAMEKDKQISDMMKQIEELKRKAEQGSQQTQGEVLELDLEAKLKEFFPSDIIEPIAKGINGADIIQTVCNNAGSKCGVILYEIKQTKRFTEGWIAKFKDDLRNAKANVPVLVATVLPESINGFGLYKGVWLSNPKYVIQLSVALRKNLISVSYERAISAGKGKKSEMLFDYISSHEFRQKVEALVEVFSDMQTQLSKERIAFEKQWSMREKQIQRLLLNTAGMYGDMQGLVGSAMPEIKGLEFENQLEDGKEQKIILTYYYNKN